MSAFDRFLEDQKMSQCEEREEGADKHHIRRPESPSVSMKSHEPGPSSVSMKSEDEPHDFSYEPGPPDTQYVNTRTRQDDLMLSYVSN